MVHIRQSRPDSGIGLQTKVVDTFYLSPLRSEEATRWSSTLSLNVNLPHAINFRALCGADLVTYPADLRGVKTGGS